MLLIISFVDCKLKSTPSQNQELGNNLETEKLQNKSCGNLRTYSIKKFAESETPMMTFLKFLAAVTGGC